MPEFVGMLGTIGIGGINAPHYLNGEYYVRVHRENGSKVIVQLPEDCIDEAPTQFRL